ESERQPVGRGSRRRRPHKHRRSAQNQILTTPKKKTHQQKNHNRLDSPVIHQHARIHQRILTRNPRSHLRAIRSPAKNRPNLEQNRSHKKSGRNDQLRSHSRTSQNRIRSPSRLTSTRTDEI